MLSKNYILHLYKKYNVQASKKFGQNFLIDPNILNIIINQSDIANANVIEIGPGLGFLTTRLLDKAKTVTAYELDRDMVEVLKNEIINKNFILKAEDFLKAQFNWKHKRIVVANIPYNITSPIIFKLLQNFEKISSSILMLQKEVGDRLMAKKGNKNYGKFSVSLQTFASIEKIIDVPKESFFPQPKVVSIVVKINFLKKPNFEYLNFIKHCFSFQRKTLFNNLKSFLLMEKTLDIMKQMHFHKNIRPQEISVQEYEKMFSLI